MFLVRRFFFRIISTGQCLAYQVVIKYDDLYYTILEWPLSPLYPSVLFEYLNSRRFVLGNSQTSVWGKSSVEFGEISSQGTGTLGYPLSEPFARLVNSLIAPIPGFLMRSHVQGWSN